MSQAWQWWKKFWEVQVTFPGVQIQLNHKYSNTASTCTCKLFNLSNSSKSFLCVFWPHSDMNSVFHGSMCQTWGFRGPLGDQKHQQTPLMVLCDLWPAPLQETRRGSSKVLGHREVQGRIKTVMTLFMSLNSTSTMAVSFPSFSPWIGSPIPKYISPGRCSPSARPRICAISQHFNQV